MASAYSDYILEGKTPQYAYALVILSGGIAFVASQLGAPIAAWLSFALLAACYGSIWPDKAWQWGVWLCLPIILLICSDLIVTGSTFGLLSNGPIFVKVLPSAFFGAYVGSKLSVRKLGNLFSPGHVSRKRVSSGGAQTGLVLKEMAVPTAIFKNFSSRNSQTPEQSLARVADFPSLNVSLVKAVQEGDLNRINLLVAQGADINAASSDQWTPLMIASSGGDIEMVKILFGEGAMPDASSGKGWTALMIATVEGRVEVVRALLEHGAQANASNNRGLTALRLAVSMDETEILRALLDAGADVNLKDNEGRTALMQAADENIQGSLKVLLGAGADPSLKDNREQTALMIARAKGHSKIIKLLKEAEAKASTGNDARLSLAENDDSYFYLLKEELEEMLNAHPTDDAVSRVLDVLQEHIETTKKERSLTPSEISHKLMLTLKEAAALSGLPRQHLLEAIEGGSLKAQLIKQAWRIKRADLDDYIRRIS